MPEFCTCGAQLVEDARFCHRCGRPTGPLAVAEEPIPQITIQPSFQAKLAQIPVSFNNPVALRVALLMSVAVIPMEMAPGLSLLSIFWWLAAGWCAVLLYRRLTGSVLSVRAGARLGSITGVLTFVGLAVAFTIAMVFAGKEFFDQMVKQNPDAKQIVNDPAMLCAVILVGLAFLFTVVVSICAAGGALGARYVGRKNRIV
ncbi:MAG: hypothetical protein KGN84_13125 [Acidobacteriota bacterium]|nr:hypothetical protein [Acidobacteriota bacterium]